MTRGYGSHISGNCTREDHTHCCNVGCPCECHAKALALTHTVTQRATPTTLLLVCTCGWRGSATRAETNQAAAKVRRHLQEAM